MNLPVTYTADLKSVYVKSMLWLLAVMTIAGLIVYWEENGRGEWLSLVVTVFGMSVFIYAIAALLIYFQSTASITFTPTALVLSTARGTTRSVAYADIHKLRYRAYRGQHWFVYSTKRTLRIENNGFVGADWMAISRILQNIGSQQQLSVKMSSYDKSFLEWYGERYGQEKR